MASHWYPPLDARQRARIDSILGWYGSTLRVGAVTVIWHRVLGKNLGLPVNDRLVEDYGLPTLKSALKIIDQVWLASDQRFLVGDELTLADLLVACEIEQLMVMDGTKKGPRMEELLSGRARVTAWLERVKGRTAPHWNEVNAMLYKATERMKSKL